MPASSTDASDTSAPTRAAAVERVGPVDRAGSASIDGGDRIGRYLVLRRLGAGGMGEVFLAYDDELDRRVAVKVLRVRSSSEAASRLRREAQALARLSDPHVVGVHEVGQVDGRIFVVMEYVAGEDLRVWLKRHGMVGAPAPRRRVAEVVELLTQAGRGLAAAHRAGLVHRDVKPDNIFVGEDGRVRVGDFGLARIGEGAVTEAGRSDDEGLTSSPSVLSAQLTAVGSTAGTPAYMAPEQRRGEVDARSDLFAYAVTFWEALMGERPFAGRGDELARAIAAGLRRPPPAGHAAPAWLVSALERALVPNPAERWPSVDALLAEITRAPRRRSRRIVGVGVCLTLLAGGGGATVALDALGARCKGAERHLVGAWDPARRAAVAAAIAAGGAAEADEVFARVAPRIDAYAAAWAAMHAEACEATTIRGEVSSAGLDLRMACLGRARQDLVAAVDVLASADAGVLLRAHELVGGLLPLERCADLDALRRGAEPPRPEEGAAVEAARAELAAAAASRRSGRFRAALAAVERAEAIARDLKDRHLRAEILHERGAALDKLGRFEEAEATLREALVEAARVRDFPLVASVGQKLLVTVGVWLARPDEGLRYREIVAGMVDGDPLGEARLAHTVGNIFFSMGRYGDSEREYRRAIALREEHLGPDHADVATSLAGFARVLRVTGRLAEAKEMLGRALAILEDEIGGGHPLFAESLTSLAIVHVELREYDEALRAHAQALAIRRAVLGPDHPDVAASLGNLGDTYVLAGEPARGLPLLEEALPISERAFGREHPEVAGWLGSIARARSELGEHEAALALGERSAAIFEQSEGPDHLDLALSLGLVARLRRDVGDLDGAEAAARRSLSIAERALPADHPSIVEVQTTLTAIASARAARDAAPARSGR